MIEATTPKYSLIERERRWLVDPRQRPDLGNLDHVLIEDQYISNTRMRLRRMTDSKTGLSVLKLTKKYECPDPLARPIVTAYLTEIEFEVFAKLDARSLAKKRYSVEGFSIDQFVGALDGLELAEIERSDEQMLRDLQPPAWAAAEVSADLRYQGGNLVIHGIPKD
ncbi:hypothetical protein [uncultured Sphingorhabdus sp.]|uniref:hypothetical protein n=1 Tax=uncultured Sphingorhabdus sp. TaxID=1686106 RepID=UPI00262FCD0E|nr:hypothetical protein [uncultured Sphingorhabdus sp.]HMS21037.1 hypothetical protein [Sphingorhabdus sp.]